MQPSLAALFDLAGRTALVTGGNSGIGEAMAMPAAPSATPLKELSSEMVMGISAPPTRTLNKTPKPKAPTRVSSKGKSGVGAPAAQMTSSMTPRKPKSTAV